MSQDTPTTPAPTFTAEQCEVAAYQRELAESAALDGMVVDAKEHLEAASIAEFAASLVRREDETCEWLEPDEDYNAWQTSCGKEFEFINDGPKQNGTVSCCYCGKRVEAAKPTEAP